MGKYSLDFLSSLEPLALKEGWSEIELILSRQSPKNPNLIAEINKKLKNTSITYLDLMPNQIGNLEVPSHNREVINTHLSNLDSFDSIDFIILSLMQGEIYPVFPSTINTQKILLFYDLVPLMFHKMYLDNPITRTEYLSKIKELLLADKYFAISKTVANDLAIYLGVDRSKIISIDGGPAKHYTSTVKKVDIPKPFILMPTGNDLRKNNERAILGFDAFNQKNNKRYKLVVTSYFKNYQLEDLKKLSSDVIFTGNVSGAELGYLYKECDMLLFPSEYEGLGMPILEALEYSKPVVCSNISVFREMSETAFLYFDTYSISEIALALESATKHSIDSKSYKMILKKYSWESTAQKAVKAIKTSYIQSRNNPKKPKVAVFSPNPSLEEGAGRLALGLHAELSRLCNCDYFLSVPDSKYEKRIDYLPYVSPVKFIEPGTQFKISNYDKIIYHIDNSSNAAGLLLIALANPGIVILYGTSLDKPWKELLNKNLINNDRYKLEERLTKAVGLSHIGVASLLSKQNEVVVFDDDAYSEINKVSTTINPDLRITLRQFPVKALVYDNVLPHKTIRLRGTDDRIFSNNITDYEYILELSKTEILINNKNASVTKLLDGMIFGVVPCCSQVVAKKLSLNEGFILYPSNKRSVKTAEELELNIDADTLLSRRNKVQDFIDNHYSYMNFAYDLSKIIEAKPETRD